MLNFSLSLIAASIMYLRLQPGASSPPDYTQGYILGIWYQDFAPAIGYITGLPILAWILFKSRPQELAWRAVWVGFLVFALLIVAWRNTDFEKHLPLSVNRWYFEISIGIPVVLIAIALLVALVRRGRLDWWTVLVAPLVIVAWLHLVIMKAMWLAPY